jgi:hypothetical protein
MGAMMGSGQRPEIAVVVPLEDPRGDVVEHLRTWTKDQTLARDRFQVVASADGRHPEFERRVNEELAPQDELVTAANATLMGLYDAASRAASAPVLVLTEAHVRAEPGCLEAVADAFARDRKLDVGTLEHLQNVTTGISQFSERWFDRAFEAWDRAGWKRLNTTGVAVSKEAYLRVGGLDSRLGLYAPSLMSARLDQEGARIAHLDRAVITHELEHEMAYSVELGGDFAHGECIVRREQDPEFCERYFGPAGLWGRRHAYQPQISGLMLAAVRSAIRHSPRDAWWLSRELAARAPARLAGPRPRLAWERAASRFNRLVASAPILPRSLRWRGYVAAQEGNVRAVQLEEVARANGAQPPLSGSSGPVEAARLDGLLIGGHGVEGDGERSFRWTEPVALIRLAPPGDDAILRLETGGLRGDPLDYLQGAYAGSTAVPRAQQSSDGRSLEIRLTNGLAERVADGGLVLISRPLAAPGDERRLGMPVYELELSPG